MRIIPAEFSVDKRIMSRVLDYFNVPDMWRNTHHILDLYLLSLTTICMHRKTTCTQLDSDTQQSIFPRSTFNSVQVVLVHKEGEANFHPALLVQVWQQDPLCRLATNSQSTWLHTSRKLARKRVGVCSIRPVTNLSTHSETVLFPSSRFIFLSPLCVFVK